MFRGEHWERRPLVVERDEPGRFDGLLSVADAERLVESGGLRFPAFRLVRSNGAIPLRAYASDLPWRPEPLSGTADPGRVAEAFRDGTTIVLQALHHTWPPLARFCRALESELEHPVQANAYYTPRRAQGFAVHHDTHDVLVLQVAGEKRWLVYEPLLELPLRTQRWSRELGEPGPPVLDVTLRAGDTLYLPRGWLHEARTSETDSLHLTIGINVYTWLDALRAAVEELADETAARRGVPAEPELPRDLLPRLEERLAPDEVARRRRTRLVETRRPVLDGQLAEVRSLDAVTLDTPLERRPTVLFDLEGTTLAFEGRRVAFPPHVRPELEAIASSERPFVARELPGDVDEAGRLVLVRRLVREGFVRRSGAVA